MHALTKISLSIIILAILVGTQLTACVPVVLGGEAADRLVGAREGLLLVAQWLRTDALLESILRMRQ